jgi:hypothetical protein
LSQLVLRRRYENEHSVWQQEEEGRIRELEEIRRREEEERNARQEAMFRIQHFFFIRYSTLLHLPPLRFSGSVLKCLYLI